MLRAFDLGLLLCAACRAPGAPSPSSPALTGPFAWTAGEWRSAAPARTRESRLVYERHGDERWRRRQEVSEDGGASWQVLFTDELERVER